jgi:hypothetical protein
MNRCARGWLIGKNIRSVFMIHSYTVDGLLVQTGDLICTTDGELEIGPGEFWRLLGRLMPGEVDHIAIYLGPGGRCIEALAKGVIIFDVDDNEWFPEKMIDKRGRFLDELHGVAYPLQGRGLGTDEQTRIRRGVAEYCLAQVGKPYNINFLDTDTDEVFYCSQLAYRAYLRFGIDLNTGLGIPELPGTSSIVFPHEVWLACHKRVTI